MENDPELAAAIAASLEQMQHETLMKEADEQRAQEAREFADELSKKNP